MKKRDFKQSDMIRIWTRVVLRVVFILAFVAFALWLLYHLRTILLLVVLSGFFCYLIAPLVRLFEHPLYVAGRELKLPRAVAIAAVYLVIGGVVFAVISSLWPLLSQQVTELARNLPGYITSGATSVRESLNDANSWLFRLKLPREWREHALGLTSQVAEKIFPFIETLVFGGLSYLQYLPWLILVPVLSFFLLKDASSFESSIVGMISNERLRRRAHYLFIDVSNTLAAYTRAQVYSCLVVGAEVTVLFSILGVRYTLVLGIISAIFEFVPLIGPLAAGVIAVSLSLTQSLNLALLVALVLIVLRIVHDYVVYPRIIGQGIHMHPLVVILAILIGAEIGGLPGIFLAIPVVGLIIVGYNHYMSYKNLQEPRLIITDEDQTPSAELPPAEEEIVPLVEK